MAPPHGRLSETSAGAPGRGPGGGSRLPISRAIAFWLAGLGVLVLGLWVLRDALLPFIAGFILAYLLDPLADRFERLGIGRLGASLAVLLLVLLILSLVLVLLVPLIGRQLTAVAAQLPEYVRVLQNFVEVRIGPYIEQLGGRESLSDLQSSIGNVVGQGISWVLGFLKSLWSGSQAVVGVVSLLVVTPVVAFYLLVDWDRMVAIVDAWIPVRHRPTVRALARDIDRALAGFIRGQAAVCLLLGTFYAVGLWLVGLNFAILIGLTAGLLSFIPYIGSFTGFILSLGVALVQFWPEWGRILLTVGVFFLGQFLEGNIISPKLVGASVGLHPVWVMFALFAFGSLFGFTGLLLAVPLAAALGVLARFALANYLSSRLYHDEPEAALPHPENDA